MCSLIAMRQFERDSFQGFFLRAARTYNWSRHKLDLSILSFSIPK